MNSYWVAHASAQKITEITKSLKSCYLINNSHTDFEIVRRQTAMTHQQRVSRSGSRVIERAVGDWCQCLPLAFVLEEDILSTCCNTNDVMKHA